MVIAHKSAKFNDSRDCIIVFITLVSTKFVEMQNENALHSFPCHRRKILYQLFGIACDGQMEFITK